MRIVSQLRPYTTAGLRAVRCVACAGVLLATSAQAVGPEDWLDGGPANVAPRGSLVATPSLSAAQAAAIVRNRHGGRVLSVSPAHSGDQRGYRVRILIDGARVRTVFVGDRKNKNPVRSIGNDR